MRRSTLRQGTTDDYTGGMTYRKACGRNGGMDIGPRGWRRSHFPDGTDGLPGAIEAAGYDGLWIAGGARPGIFDTVETLLAATERITIGIGIVNIWMETPETVTAGW